MTRELPRALWVTNELGQEGKRLENDSWPELSELISPSLVSVGICTYKEQVKNVWAPCPENTQACVQVWTHTQVVMMHFDSCYFRCKQLLRHDSWAGKAGQTKALARNRSQGQLDQAVLVHYSKQKDSSEDRAACSKVVTKCFMEPFLCCPAPALASGPYISEYLPMVNIFYHFKLCIVMTLKPEFSRLVGHVWIICLHTFILEASHGIFAKLPPIKNCLRALQANYQSD